MRRIESETDEFLGYPEKISFMTLTKPSKRKCLLCGEKETQQYEGEGLKWALCLRHAIRTHLWAFDNEPGLREQAGYEAALDLADKYRRAADRMEISMREKWDAA